MPPFFNRPLTLKFFARVLAFKMNEIYPLIEGTPVSLTGITSRLNRALTPQEVVCTLADTIASPLQFDYCSLIVPASDAGKVRIWRASRDTSCNGPAAVELIEPISTLLTELLDRTVPTLLSERELQRCGAREFGRDTKSVLVLPLSAGGRSVGMICLTSAVQDIYTNEDAQGLSWLADHVAAVTQAVLLGAKMDVATDRLSEIGRLKSGFINTLVHDVRLPLTSVLGVLELFESKLQARELFDMEDRQLLSSAIESGDRMRRLLDDHLEIAQQQERPLTLNLESLDVEQLIEEVAEPLRGEAALRGVEMNIGVGARKFSVHVDGQQTRRALCHLLKAALAATPDGGLVQVEAQALTGTRIGDEGRRFVVINIADSGQGIPAEQVPFMFDAFWQTGSSRSQRGYGIGLAIAKRIAAAHGGNVALRSQIGIGTTYSIILPATQPHAASYVRRILIVDDAPEILLLLSKLVARMGYQVEIASGARPALKVLHEKQIDLLITDWAMPEMNGGELIAALKSQPQLSAIPVIVLTGHDTETERDEAAAAGCARFLVKPVKRDELQSVITELLPTSSAVR